MKHIFGPVNSRRLGRSLGIDLFTEKICNLNCIYCEVGANKQFTSLRNFHAPIEAITAEMVDFCADKKQLEQIDVVTITASGEPTLHSGLGKIVQRFKELTGKKIVVLTNGTTLHDKDVRLDLEQVDIVVPSLDSVLGKSFRRLNRPHPDLDLDAIIEGLIIFSKEFKGSIWLEILFAKGFNDTEDDVEAFCRILPQLKVDRIQLNTVARPPLEQYAKPVSHDFLQTVAERFSQIQSSIPVEFLTEQKNKKIQTDVLENRPVELTKDRIEAVQEKIVSMLKRRPCTADDINKVFHVGSQNEIEMLLELLIRAGDVEKTMHGDKSYYHGKRTGVNEVARKNYPGNRDL